jgi:ATP-dependent helicase HrpB
VIEAVLPEVRRVLGDNLPLVLTAEPGAGKTTLLPPALLEEPWLGGKKILLLEPRRVAARAAAARMASARGEAPGKTVGWRMAQDTCVGPSTRLEVVTEGVLTRMVQNDPGLEGVGLVLFDEFHERSLNADLGLALTLDVRRELRPDLRIGLLSATLDADAVRSVLTDAVAVHAPGRVFPVSTAHRPPAEGEDAAAAVARAVVDGWDAVPGGLLVFLPGWGEIRRVADRVSDEARRRGETLLILHGSLDPKDQAAVLEPLPGGRRKTVLATSVAETSLTIPDIDLVIDSGLARMNRFDQGRGLDRLVTERVSQASADQRRGRAGRTKPGVCWRLWPAAERLIPATDPEILRADLSGPALEAAVWGARDPGDLTWMTPPPAGAWARARDLLADLGALDPQGRITPEGRALAALGTGPRLGVLLRRAEPADRALAAACAALLQDRDPLPTSGDPDLRLRLEPLFAGEAGPVWFRLRDAAKDLLRRIEPSARDLRPAPAWAGAVGRVLAPAFPDRIAARTEGTAASAPFRITGGRMLRVRGPLASEPWIVVADADAGEGTGWVSLAAPLTEAQALAALGPLTRVSVEAEWDGWKPRVFRVRRAGAHVLERTGLRVTEAAAEVRQALTDRLASLDPESLPWTPSSRQLVHRMGFLDHAGPADWAWLADHADLSGGPVFTEERLRRALEDGLPWDLRTRLDREAPETLVVPSGSRRRLDYRDDGTVVLEVRIQEVFGLAESPRVGGRPVLLHLLSPAQRPLQVTSDLASFWKNTYPEVRKEMRGRYPRHYWPDNPLEAEPTARAKPRGT